jgi:hypothetical protein
LKKKCEVFDYKFFSKNINDSIFILKDKKVDIDELIKRLDSYVL